MFFLRIAVYIGTDTRLPLGDAMKLKIADHSLNFVVLLLCLFNFVELQDYKSIFFTFYNWKKWAIIKNISLVILFQL